jgi:hypothetical protein
MAKNQKYKVSSVFSIYLEAFSSFTIASEDIDQRFDYKLIDAYGFSAWYRFRNYISNTIFKCKQIKLENIFNFLQKEYSFFGIGGDFIRKTEKQYPNALVRFYDPSIDNTGFCDNLNNFSDIDREWIKNNSEGMDDQNSHNFKEFLKILYNLRSRIYIPKFSFVNTSTVRDTYTIRSPDGRITVEWFERQTTKTIDYRIYIVYLVGLSLCYGLISAKIASTIINVYLPDFNGIIDICYFIGRGIKIVFKGKLLKSLKPLLKNRRSKEKVVKRLARYLDFYRKREKDLPRLPTARKALPPSKIKALPKARDG